jgi:polyhydroxyalkanoate synthesis regulator phasin
MISGFAVLMIVAIHTTTSGACRTDAGTDVLSFARRTPQRSNDNRGRAALSEPVNDGQHTADASSAEATEKKPRGRKASSARKTRTVELTLTVTGTADGEWQADLLHSGKRVVQGLPIPAASVSKAAAELHQDISDVIETVLSTAREQHQTKLAELEAEVERVRKALAELES